MGGADGAQYVNLPDHRPDVLLVDGFNADGLPAELGSRSFYEACRRRLSDDGMLVANLVTDEPDFHRYLRSLREVFGNAVTLAPSEASEHNVTILAWKGGDGVPSLMTMFDRARWTNKPDEAEVFRRWLSDRLHDPLAAPPTAVQATPGG